DVVVGLREHAGNVHCGPSRSCGRLWNRYRSRIRRMCVMASASPEHEPDDYGNQQDPEPPVARSTIGVAIAMQVEAAVRRRLWLRIRVIFAQWFGHSVRLS